MPNPIIGLAQLNTIVGAPEDNAAAILRAARAACERGAQVLLTPELSLPGAHPHDLLLRPAFLDAQDGVLHRLAAELAALPLHVVVGHAHREGSRLYNSAAVLHGGAVVARHHKSVLLATGGLDELRYFTPGRGPGVFSVNGMALGLLIGQDAQSPDAVKAAVVANAQALLVLDADPYTVQAQELRLARASMRDSGLPWIQVNRVGGQDDVVYDGASFAVDGQGAVVLRLPVFEEALGLVQLDPRFGPTALESDTCDAWPERHAQIWQALTVALRDYMRHNGFSDALLGMSGGMDSALVLALAVDAVGADRVRAVMMPSRYTADISLSDARTMSQGLGVRYDEINIQPIFAAYEQSLAPLFGGAAADITEENLQARIRGNLLMALSNKHGGIVLATGNKSEVAAGYATLYGDMVGGFAPLKDVPKTWVYELAHWRNRQSPVIPQRIIDRPPSAELRPDQTDQDSLPPYDVLDAIVERYVEGNASLDAIVAAGFDRAVVARVLHLIRISEYKRQQGAVGPRITSRAFGSDWRMPLGQGFTEGP